MLSYVHAFHAGNYADILKHSVFVFTLEHLLKKDKPFTVIDTHSGSGKYSLLDERLIKTQEAQNGIKKLIQNDTNALKEIFGPNFAQILENYIQKNEYPGSPEIARSLLRTNDSLILNELHPKVIEELRQNVSSPLELNKQELPQIQINSKDAKIMLNAAVPPKIKRGCVIIDPSYEDKNEYEETAKMFINAYKKWATATYLIWYPLLQDRETEIAIFKQNIIAAVEKTNNTQDEKCLSFEIQLKQKEELNGISKMYGSGMLVANPPFGLKEKMHKVLPLLEKLLR